MPALKSMWRLGHHGKHLFFIKSNKSVFHISFSHRSNCRFVNTFVPRELRSSCFTTLVSEEFCLNKTLCYLIFL